MIRYTSQHQLRFEDFRTPFEQQLLPTNRWVILARVLPWDELAQVYHRQMSAELGRGALDTRLIIGALIVKHMLKLDDREVIATLQENIYLQYFVGFSSFQTAIAFDPSLFVTIRNRMGIAEFDDWSLAVITQIEVLEAANEATKTNKNTKINKNTETNKFNTETNKNIEINKNTKLNKFNIETNKFNDTINELDIETNKFNDTINELDIETNKLDIETNKFNIEINEKIETNKNIETNKFNTKTNKLDTEKNKNTETNKNAETNKLNTPIPIEEILIIDTTVAEQKIKFPTDLGLLNDTREFLEGLIDTFHNELVDNNKKNNIDNKEIIVIKKPRDYRQVARKEYLNLALKRRKSAKEIRKVNKKQLIYINRNTQIINNLCDKLIENNLNIPFTKKTYEIWETSQLIYIQQRQMILKNTKKCDNRIVSLYQPHVRPIVRGKAHKNIEFGAKIGLSVVNKTNRIFKLSWDAYNDGIDLIGQVEAYKKQYKKYPKLVLADKIYMTKANREYLKERNIQHRGKALGKSKQIVYNHTQQQEANQRNHVEGQFGTAKDAYELNKVKAKTQPTSESWIANIFFVMNIIRLLKVAQNANASSVAILLTTLITALIDFFLRPILRTTLKENSNNYYSKRYQLA